MTTNYDPIAEQYKLSKQQPWRTHIEAYSLLQLIGNPAGLSVLDVACGEGFYTRLLRQQGAARVTGVDLSQGMIDLARKQETLHQQGIDYLVGDARNLELHEQYDLVVAAYLLNYAQDREELAAMTQGIARCLKPGGRFVTVNSNPALDFPTAPSYRKFGFETTIGGDFREGSPIKWTFYLDGSCFDIENYYLDVAIHEAAFQAAGFRETRWHPPQFSPQGLAEFGGEFWLPFNTHPPVAFIECVK